jgi:hypothetical protein
MQCKICDIDVKIAQYVKDRRSDDAIELAMNK